MVTEVLPGLFRLGEKLGDRFFYQYLFVGDRTLLVDTGVPATPEEVIIPSLNEIGLKPSDIDFVLISHSDVDHFGGNRSLRNRAPQALFLAHRLDAPLIEDKAKILKERYGWYKKFGLGYPEKTRAWLEKSAGTPIELDVYLSNELSIRIGKNRLVKLLHLPGHSSGHMGVYDEKLGAIVVGDAVLGTGVVNTNMEIIAPPPYIDVNAYADTIRKILSLRPEYLFASHYPAFRARNTTRFLRESARFVKELERNILEILQSNHEGLELSMILREADSRVGPFKSFSNELAASIKAHLEKLEHERRVKRRTRGGKIVWQAIS